MFTSVKWQMLSVLLIVGLLTKVQGYSEPLPYPLKEPRAAHPFAFTYARGKFNNDIYGYNRDLIAYETEVTSPQDFPDAFRKDKGYFIAPVEGLYHFSYHVVSKSYGLQVGLFIRRAFDDEQLVVSSYANSPKTAATGSAYLNLGPSDMVYVKVLSGKFYEDTQDSAYTSFSGALVWCSDFGSEGLRTGESSRHPTGSQDTVSFPKLHRYSASPL